MVGGVQAVFLLLLVFVAVFAGLARRLKVPYPILLVVAGLLLSFLPGMPRIGLDPNLVFLVFLPPLLYSAAWTLSWREFQRNFVSIAMLAVGLVSFTVLGLAMTHGSLLPGFDWKSAVLLGAVVAAAVWDALTFVLNGIVFVLIGLQLPYVMAQIGGLSHMVLLEYGIGFSAAIIVLRMAWVYGETYIECAIRRCSGNSTLQRVACIRAQY